jgi:hypothetical protein
MCWTLKQKEEGARDVAKQSVSDNLPEERHEVTLEEPDLAYSISAYGSGGILAYGAGVFGGNWNLQLVGSGEGTTSECKEEGRNRELPIRRDTNKGRSDQRRRGQSVSKVLGKRVKVSWLGDRESPRTRVKTHIAAAELDLIESTGRNPGGMAKERRKCLVAQESQSGSGLIRIKIRGRKRLFPELIYEIWCHLKRRFTMSKPEWKEIRISMKAKVQPPGLNDWKKFPYADPRLGRCTMCSEKRRYKFELLIRMKTDKNGGGLGETGIQVPSTMEGDADTKRPGEDLPFIQTEGAGGRLHEEIQPYPTVSSQENRAIEYLCQVLELSIWKCQCWNCQSARIREGAEKGDRDHKGRVSPPLVADKTITRL